MSTRLQKQLWRMAEGYADRVVLLVETGHVPKKALPVLRAALSYVKARIEPVMYVAYTRCHEDTLRLLVYWKQKGDLVFYAHRPVRKAAGSKDMLMALPGIGEGTKEKIVRSGLFSSLTDFINNIDRVKDLVPAKTFARLRSFVGQKWK